MTATIHVVVIALVRSNGEILLVMKRDDGQWGPPLGWMRPGESIKETAKRKVSEESGVLVSTERILAMRSILPGEDREVGELQVLIECHPLAGAPRPGVCELEAAYKPVGNLPPLRNELAEWIMEALADPGHLLG